MLDLQREEIGELLAAAKYNWKEVDPAIFGTLLEQALNDKDRARLGAHYTPRAYVERLVVVTIMEPLRQEWARVQATAERLKEEKKTKEAKAAVQAFHDRLCATRVLDPACGTGNFLYVAMELMKRLEGEVLEALVDLGGQEALKGLEGHNVDPHQFLGLEKNPRAAAIAELVIWLGYLQWHYRTRGGDPSEPILRDFGNLTVMDAVLTWDGYPLPKIETKDGKRVEAYPNARRPEWPEAEFIVGNPPFIGKGEPMRSALGDAYLRALWSAHADMNEGDDFVMYWWDRAAETVANHQRTQRFGLVTTNSIGQAFNRRVIERHLSGRQPISLLMAIPDHPWTKATENAAAVRIAMTVAAAGHQAAGAVRRVTAESKLDTDQPEIELSAEIGIINPDLTVGTNVTVMEGLQSNEGVCSPGMQLSGQGFIVDQNEYSLLRERYGESINQLVRPYSNGRQLLQHSSALFVIDAYPRTETQLRTEFPHVYQILLERVKPDRERNNRESYRINWWTFAEPRKELRPAFQGLVRYIATVRTTKHRIFMFVAGSLVAESKIVMIGSDDAFVHGILSSRCHVMFSLRAGGWLGVGNDPTYNHSDCFDPFPFPDCSDALKAKIRAVAEELDAHRKARQAEHPKLTLTQMYNVLEKLRATSPSPRASPTSPLAPSARGEGRGEGQRQAPAPASLAAPHPSPLPASGERESARGSLRGEFALSTEEEDIKQKGLVLILKELHDKLDALVFEAYGWQADLTDEQILEKLVALNKERALKEKASDIKWLRPDYQIPRFGSDAERARLAEEKRQARELKRASQEALDLEDDLQEMKAKFPTGKELEETAAVMRVLASATAPLSVADIARSFAQGKSIEKRVELTVSALARLGHLISTDDAKTFALRRAA